MKTFFVIAVAAVLLLSVTNAKSINNNYVITQDIEKCRTCLMFTCSGCFPWCIEMLSESCKNCLCNGEETPEPLPPCRGCVKPCLLEKAEYVCPYRFAHSQTKHAACII